MGKRLSKQKDDLVKEQEIIPERKVMFLGKSGAGKSAIIHKFIAGPET